VNLAVLNCDGERTTGEQMVAARANGRGTRRLGWVVTLAFALSACGATPPALPAAGPTATPLPPEQVERAATRAAERAASTAPPGSGEPQAVRVPLQVGSSGEVPARNPDPFDANAVTGTLRVTVTGILDPAMAAPPTRMPEAGHRFWAVQVTLEATGEAPVNAGVWTLRTVDGQVYPSSSSGLRDELGYRAIRPGESVPGTIPFAIPEDAEIAEVIVDALLRDGATLVFER
jgi:hypothetical protein